MCSDFVTEYVWVVEFVTNAVFYFRLCHKLVFFVSDFVTNYVKHVCVFRFVHKLCVFNRFQLVLNAFTNHVLFSEFVANYVVLAKSQTMCWFSDFVINYSVSDFATNRVLSSEFVTKYVVSAKSQTLWVCVCCFQILTQIIFFQILSQTMFFV